MIMNAMNSVATSTYDGSRIHIFISFDGFHNQAVFMELLKVTKATIHYSDKSIHAQGKAGTVGLTLSIFEHGGKTHCQEQTVNYIRAFHSNYVENASETCVLFLDADTVINQSALRLFGGRLVSFDAPHLMILMAMC